MRKKADIAVVGLAVMGENLILNMESKGFTVACFNRTTSKVDAFVNGRAAGKNIIGCRSMEELVGTLKRPRKVMCMIKAGRAVDDFIEAVTPFLETGDVITLEPGCYLPGVGGMRFEHNYLIAEDGAEQLSQHQLGLVR